MHSLEIQLPLPPLALSPNEVSSRVWQARHSATKSYRALATVAAKAAMPANWGQCPVRIDAEFWCGRSEHELAVRAGTAKKYKCRRVYRPLDSANATSSLKAAVDGLVDAGITPSDSHRWVKWGEVNIYRRKKEHNGRSGVVLTIHPQAIVL